MKQASKDFSWKELYHYLFVRILSKRVDSPNVAMNHIIAESQKWTHKPSESCRREQWKNAVRLSFLRTDVLSSQHRYNLRPDVISEDSSQFRFISMWRWTWHRFLSETASLKNCYAFSYISMAVFMGFLRHVTYTCDISFSVFSACLFQLACCQSASFHYGDERKD